MAAEGKKPAILVVDDEPSNIALLEAHLAPRGYEVIPAANGGEALARLASEPIDLVLLDVMMPLMDGFEVLRRIRADERTRLMPVVLVTALRETEHRIRGIEAGCDDFISKPFDGGEVVARVAMLLKMSFYRRELDEKEKFEALLDGMAEGLLVLNKELRVQRMNGPAARMLFPDGVPPSPELARHLPGRFRIAGAVDWSAGLALAPLSFDAEREEAGADRIVLNIRSVPIRAPGGGVASIVVVVRDVSGERMEERLQRGFLSLLSHKLRTPLTVVNMKASFLREGMLGAVSPKQEGACREIERAVMGMDHLLDKLFKFTALGLDRPDLPDERIEVKGAIEAAAGRAVPPAPGRRATLAVECGEGLAVKLNRVYFDAIVENLVENAVKFSGREEVHISIAARRVGDRIEVAVADDGRGIPLEEQENIFRKFYQIERSFTGNVEGVGLGLAAAKQILEVHGGTIRVESAPGKGATFTVTLPAA